MTAPAVSTGLVSIGQIAINTRNLPRAVAFYRDVLGIPFMFEAPPSLAFFRCGDVSLMLGG
jgi:methylmalonyl-CoA/ethylmalonyl-CoA epimerase